ncbi:GntR family transcriptional regulator [Desulfitibacter alkalitolerans]|uniref:GntR family transcriptional regulator n=1 Tax=Desulfitibacter alkalitolerans TaxID=264641 RepID=UPI000483E80F|nr:GntR family transcriptional regulator [Desulfitibacter alkalitolerans]
MPKRKSFHSERIYNEIKSQIISGVLKPREKIFEQDLAEQLEVSRTPIRESINRLLAEGLLIKDFAGTVVKDINLSHMMEVYELRAVLEGYIAGEVVEKLTKEDFDKLEITLAKQRRSLELKQYVEAAKAGTEFHWILIQKSANVLYQKTLATLFDECERFRNVTFFFEACRRNIIVNHQDLIDVLKEGNKKKVEEKFREHLLELRREIEQMNLDAIQAVNQLKMYGGL